MSSGSLIRNGLHSYSMTENSLQQDKGLILRKNWKKANTKLLVIAFFSTPQLLFIPLTKHS